MNLRKIADAAAKRYGVPPGLFRRLIQQESGWNPDARNPSGATGLVQIHLPSHPDISEEQARDPAFALGWGARYLATQKARFGRWDLALAAYNAGPGNVENGKWQSFPETRNYVKNILGGKTAVNAVGAAPPPLGAAAPALSALPQATQSRNANLLSSIFDSNNQILGLNAPVGILPKPPEPVAVPLPKPSSGQALAGGLAMNAPGGWEKFVGKIERRHGPSKPHAPDILRFVGKVGQLAGQVLTPWGNESHSLTTVSGNRSAHADGFAADIPASGQQLVRLGQAALIAAGMSPAEARKQKGGLFNVGGYQVIFATNVGGNHHDHLHVGIRR
jgi:hypothetical protein